MSKEMKLMMLNLLLALLLSVGTTLATNQVTNAVQDQKISQILKVDVGALEREVHYLKTSAQSQEIEIRRQGEKQQVLEVSQIRVITVLENLTKAIDDFTQNQRDIRDTLSRLKEK